MNVGCCLYSPTARRNNKTTLSRKYFAIIQTNRNQITFQSEKQWMGIELNVKKLTLNYF